MGSGRGRRRASWKRWTDESGDIFRESSSFLGKLRKMERPSWDGSWVKHRSESWYLEWWLKRAEFWELSRKRIPWPLALVHWESTVVDLQLTEHHRISGMEYMAFLDMKWLSCLFGFATAKMDLWTKTQTGPAPKRARVFKQQFFFFFGSELFRNMLVLDMHTNEIVSILIDICWMELILCAW